MFSYLRIFFITLKVGKCPEVCLYQVIIFSLFQERSDREISNIKEALNEEKYNVKSFQQVQYHVYLCCSKIRMLRRHGFWLD